VKVVVLMGGHTAERAVSFSTGSGVAASLRRLGHEVVSIDAGTGRLLPAGKELESAEEISETRDLAPVSPSLVRVSQLDEADVVFIALHGGAGEDGTLQAVLDLTRKPYTGSGHLASAAAMDKALSKRLFEHAGVPTPRWLLVAAAGPSPDADDLAAVGGFPLVFKPNDQGSTVGLSIVRGPREIEAAFALAGRHGREVLIEAYVPGRELTVGMLGPEPLPVVEIVPQHDVYDYECKYTPGMSRYDVPADLPPELAAHLQDLARRAYEVLGCRGVARVDFRLDPENRPSCLEVNTVPGMTPTSLVPMAARAAGLTYDDLVRRMVEMALSDARERNRDWRFESTTP
jgi:D-alanine-D-alanine ligase